MIKHHPVHGGTGFCRRGGVALTTALSAFAEMTLTFDFCTLDAYGYRRDLPSRPLRVTERAGRDGPLLR